MTFSPTLALDYGEQRIGVARSVGILTEPVTVLANDGELLDRLQRLIAEYQIEQIVVGISENQTAQRTIEFVDWLKSRLDVPIETFDETLSTQQAKTKIRQVRQLGQKEPIDHFAAAEFLQDWLEGR